MMPSMDQSHCLPNVEVVKTKIWSAPEPASASYNRLIGALEKESKEILDQSSNIVPQFQFSEIENGFSESQRKELEKRGCCIIRGVVDTGTVEKWAIDAEKYVTENDYHGTKNKSEGEISNFFEQKTPQIYGVYWNKPQVQARQHPNMAKVKIKTKFFFLFFIVLFCSIPFSRQKRKKGKKLTFLSPFFFHFLIFLISLGSRNFKHSLETK